jgi:hypothetical protein
MRLLCMRRGSKDRVLLFAFAFMVGSNATAVATPIAFTSEATWLAAVSGVTTETFATSPLGTLAAGTTDIGQFSITVDVTDPVSPFTGISDAGFVNGTRELFTDLWSVGPETTALSFGGFDAGTLRGFAFDLNGGASSAGLTVTINSVSFSVGSLLGFPGTGFLGFVDPDGFSSLSFGVESGGNEQFALDSARMATGVSEVSAVPEPATLFLFGTGLAATGYRQYRQRKP